MNLLSNFEKLLCRPLVLYACFFVMGIVICGSERSSGYSPPTEAFDCNRGSITALAAAVLVFAGGSILLFVQMRSAKDHKIRVMFYSAVWLVCPAFLIAGYFRTVEAGVPGVLRSFLERKSDGTVIGTVNDISLRQDGYILTLTDNETRIGADIFRPEKLNIIINSETLIGFEPEPGMRVKAFGKLYPFEKATNPGQFNSDMYYRIRRIEAKMYASAAELQDETDGEDKGGNCFETCGHWLKKGLYHMRCRLTEGIFAILPEKEAGTLTAMLTGDRGLLDSEIKDLYSEGGIAHILSISALHITLLGMGLFRLLMFITKRLRACSIITFLIILSYGIFTGFSVSTQRAVIMILVMLLARNLGRGYERLSSCGGAALIILMMQPLYLYDGGFLLSFTAVIAINVSQWITEVCKVKNPMLKAILPCLAIWLFTLPVVMCTYYRISFLSVLINPVVLIFMSMLLVSGLIAGVLSAVFSGGVIASLFSGPVYFILRLYEYLCETEKHVPYSHIITGTCGKISVMVFYSILITATVITVRYKKKKSLFALILCAFIFVKPGASGRSVSFLDVGQGDCAVFMTDNGTVLVDGGSGNVGNVGKYRIKPFLMYHGINELNAVFVSHTDKDHISGIMELIEGGYPKIKKLYVGYNVGDAEELILSAKGSGITVEKIAAGDMIDTVLDAAEIRILAPAKDRSYEDKNSASAVMLVSFDDRKLLFTGDSGFSSEEDYSKNARNMLIDVLKVAHHGSKYSTSQLLLDRVDIKTAVISCGKYNSYGHPAPETLLRLQKEGAFVFRTSQNGCITISFDDENVIVGRFVD